MARTVRRCVPSAQLQGVVLGKQRLGVNLVSLIAALRERTSSGTWTRCTGCSAWEPWWVQAKWLAEPGTGGHCGTHPGQSGDETGCGRRGRNGTQRYENEVRVSWSITVVNLLRGTSTTCRYPKEPAVPVGWCGTPTYRQAVAAHPPEKQPDKQPDPRSAQLWKDASCRPFLDDSLAEVMPARGEAQGTLRLRGPTRGAAGQQRRRAPPLGISRKISGGSGAPQDDAGFPFRHLARPGTLSWPAGTPRFPSILNSYVRSGFRIRWSNVSGRSLVAVDFHLPGNEGGVEGMTNRTQ